MSDPSERPARPAYGEYATPEEQRARIRQPDATAALSAGQSLDTPTASLSTPPAVAPPSAASPGAAPAADGAASVRPPRVWDRFATFALLGYGLFSVLTSIPSFTDYATYANSVLDIMGVDAQFTDAAAGRGWGLAAAFVIGLGWLLTFTLSWLSIRRGRLTWWIPLVGGVVFTLTASVLLVVPLFGDPTVWNALMGSVG